MVTDMAPQDPSTTGLQDPPLLEATPRRATGLPRHSEAKAWAATIRAAFSLVVIAPGLIVSDFRRGALKYNTADYGFWVGGNTERAPSGKRQAGSGRREAEGAWRKKRNRRVVADPPA